MKVLTNKQFDKYTAQLIESNYKEGLADGLERGYESGYERGYESGRRSGLMADKKGILMESSGLYVFEDGVAVKVSESE